MIRFSSDIDLIVYSSDGRHWDSEELLKIMSDLRNDFCRFGVCRQEEIQVLHSATVPIIKLTDHRTDVKVDMSFNMNGGPRSTQLILVRCVHFNDELDLQLAEERHRKHIKILPFFLFRIILKFIHT